MYHIAFIGVDGCGKTTIIRLLTEYIEKVGLKVSGCNIKGENYWYLENNFESKDINRDILAVACALDLHKRYYECCKNKSDVVIWDRFSYCIEACNPQYVFNMVKDILKNITTPNLIFYLEIEPEVAMQRICNRSEGVKNHETLEYLQRCHNEYECLSKKYNFIHIDSNRDIFEVVNEIILILKESSILC